MSQVHKLLQDRFQPDIISEVEACKILKSAFQCLSRGGVKQTYALGVEIMEATSSDRGQHIHDVEERLSRYENFRQLLDKANSMMSQSGTCLHGPTHCLI